MLRRDRAGFGALFQRLSARDSGAFSLYTVDTSNGNLTPIGPYGSATNIVGLAFSPVPEPGTLALGAIGLALAGLLRRRWRRAQG